MPYGTAAYGESALALGRSARDVGLPGLLIQGYQGGDLSFVYPLARGIAPVLLTGLAFFSIGESITSQQLLGVISTSLGIATLAFLDGADSQVSFILFLRGEYCELQPA